MLYTTVRAVSLDEIEAAHGSVGGSGRGRRYATEQINHAYTVLLASQFQGFCRDLHNECVEALVNATAPVVIQPMFRAQLLRGRQLDKGNASRENITADFERFRIPFNTQVIAADRRNVGRYRRLLALNTWRNAIAHQDFARLTVSGTTPVLRLVTVREWRAACSGLAVSYDRVMRSYLAEITGTSPW